MDYEMLKITFGMAVVFLLNACNFQTNIENQNEDSVIVVDDSSRDQTEDSISPVTDVGQHNKINCDGVGEINFKDDYAAIESKIGKENISVDSNFVEGEFQSIYHTLFNGTPKEIKVFWEDAYFKKKIGTLELENPNSVYSFDNGIKVGATLAALAKPNGGEPVRFYGFNWDYGGNIMNFSEGKIRKELDCLSGRLD